MSGQTTHSMSPMDCDRVAREDLLENYLGDRLSPDDREAFEQHYFACARCFDDLRLLESIHTALRPAAQASALPTRQRLTWLATAAGLAAVIVLASVVVLWRGRDMSVAPPDAGANQTVSEIPAPNPTPTPQPPAAPRPSLQELARVEPAPYEPLTFRSVSAEAAAFRRGMERYRQADYRGAIVDLRAAEEGDPDAPHVHFFLGVSRLLLGEDTDAVDQLRTTIALGDSPYLEEAHFYLAKAFLRQKNLDAAERQLQELIALGGSTSGEAKQLIAQLGRLREP
jgi:hypothetical protein